ncbi:MAG: dihydroorotate dehydrogenase electron transfer subunit [Candidatus Methanomethylicota archaeon]|uniref:Dihydroorotate dehydrogenase electron transfer subunit n=3 Tax=Thermoproteota archaeon TaxID=2056631 RepID=A0A497EYZ8_9CREN|nr:MAG: dihydroorotate dehydrogenase electron transfer subunit [Candidatus Verstraetearchaeota archaeon]
MINRPIPCEIISIVDEAAERKTITVKCPVIAREAHPGQFIMVWIPRIDEIPMGISHIGEEEISFTVHRVGEATDALYNMKVGDRIGLRGPYGNGFKIVKGKVLVVGGGTGMAPLTPLIERLVEVNADVTVINGAKRKCELVSLGKLRSLEAKGKIKLMIATNDGSLGEKATAAELAEKLLNQGFYDEIYVCGPEPMILSILKIAKKKGIHMQASLERYMKCAIGVCGSCVMDPLGLRVCKDGPVFPIEVLEKLHELGRYRRNAAGIKEPI